MMMNKTTQEKTSVEKALEQQDEWLSRFIFDITNLSLDELNDKWKKTGLDQTDLLLVKTGRWIKEIIMKLQFTAKAERDKHSLKIKDICDWNKRKEFRIKHISQLKKENEELKQKFNVRKCNQEKTFDKYLWFIFKLLLALMLLFAVLIGLYDFAKTG